MWWRPERWHTEAATRRWKQAEDAPSVPTVLTNNSHSLPDENLKNVDLQGGTCLPAPPQARISLGLMSPKGIFAHFSILKFALLLKFVDVFANVSFAPVNSAFVDASKLRTTKWDICVVLPAHS